MSIQRQFERNARVNAGIKHPKVLDAFNDTQFECYYLHPTKGYRKVTIKRSHAAIITHEIKTGQVPFSMKLMQQAIRG